MRLDRHPPSRLAIVFVVVGLALSAIGIAYMAYAGRPRQLPAVTAPQDDPRIEQLRALVKMLGLSFLLFLAFLIGLVLIVRVGRRLLAVKPVRQPTEYVDAWGSYRLTQEEIDTATDELDDEFPPDALPGGDPQPPDETR